MQKIAPIPEPSSVAFQGGINHPDLWLWDSWTYEEAGLLILHCLALSRRDKGGKSIAPAERNDFRFHVREFQSTNLGQSWKDCGVFFSPEGDGASAHSRNVWSGSLARHSDQYLFAYTGIREIDNGRQFHQSICMMHDSHRDLRDANDMCLLSCPTRDYQQITNKGYYLGPPDSLGLNAGEAGGPIMAWRDPFLFIDHNDTLFLFWSAKMDPKTPVIASAKLEKAGRRYRIRELFAPMPLPDAEHFTQAEVPKVAYDSVRGCYYLLISACNRLYEGQPDVEVAKEQRLYKSHTLAGPWVPYFADFSLLPDLDYLFGASILSADFTTGDLTIVAPFTEMIAAPLQLTFAPRRTINIYTRQTSNDTGNTTSHHG